MSTPLSGVAHSIHVRLIRHARDRGVDANLILSRYAAERFLYRLSVSPFSDQFVLKGGMLMLVWLGEAIRPTRDMDLLGFGDLSGGTLSSVIRQICCFTVADDGLRFESESIGVQEIRRHDPYSGRRVTVVAFLGPARIRVQIDVGIGDSVVPSPEWQYYPCILNHPEPHLKAYLPETAIAEKLHAMVTLGDQNSRMKDFYDVLALRNHRAFSGKVLGEAIQSTFQRRDTKLPQGEVRAFSDSFRRSRAKQQQWTAFLKKNRLENTDEDFAAVVSQIHNFLEPILTSLTQNQTLEKEWLPRGPWQ